VRQPRAADPAASANLARGRVGGFGGQTARARVAKDTCQMIATMSPEGHELLRRPAPHQRIDTIQVLSARWRMNVSHRPRWRILRLR
jgi:hypothetical protein